VAVVVEVVAKAEADFAVVVVVVVDVVGVVVIGTLGKRIDGTGCDLERLSCSLLQRCSWKWVEASTSMCRNLISHELLISWNL